MGGEDWRRWKDAWRAEQDVRKASDQAATVASEDAMRIRLEVQVARDEVRDLAAAARTRIPPADLERLTAIGDRLATALAGRGPRPAETASRWRVLEALRNAADDHPVGGRPMFAWSLTLRSLGDEGELQVHGRSRTPDKFTAGQTIVGDVEPRRTGAYLVGARVVEAPGA